LDGFKMVMLRFFELSGLPVLLLTLGISMWLQLLGDPLVLFTLTFFTVSFLGSVLVLHRRQIWNWWSSGYIYEDEMPVFEVPIDGKHIERQSATIERKNVNEKARGKPIETPSHTIEASIEDSEQPIEKDVSIPSKEDLEALKTALKIKKGFLHYKEYGDKVYHVFYVPELKRQTWKALGTWTELKAHLQKQLLTVVADP